MNKRIGKQTLLLPSAPSIVGYASVVGQKEGEGPLKDCFDLISEDSYFGEQTWEKALGTYSLESEDKPHAPPVL